MENLEIHITKSWRKTLSMRFDTKGVLQVKAPKFCMKYQIEAFIQKNKPWIEREHAKLVARNQNKKYYLFGSSFKFPLSEGDTCKAGGGVDAKKLETFYKKQARDYIIPRCEQLAKEHGFSFKAIRITSAMTRWGSCSSLKTLNFSYRLIMAPKESIDYVIIHELCHLRQMNHSSKFWSEVAAIMPDYKTYERHLKTDGWKYKI